jgi:hypothetical protein
MSCPRATELHGIEHLGPTEVIRLEAHVQGCAECLEARTLLAGVVGALRAAPVEPSPDALRSIRRGLHDRGTRAWWPRLLPILVASSAAVLALAVARRGPQAPASSATLFAGAAVADGRALAPQAPLPSGTVLTLAPGSSVLFGEARVVNGPRTRVVIPSVANEPLDILEGSIAVASDAAPGVWVTTPGGRIRLIAGVVRVRVDAGRVAIANDRGSVEVVDGEGRAHVVAVGEEIRLDPGGSGPTRAAPPRPASAEEPARVEPTYPSRASASAPPGGASPEDPRRRQLTPEVLSPSVASDVSAPDSPSLGAPGVEGPDAPRELPAHSASTPAERIAEARSFAVTDAQRAGRIARAVLREGVAPELEAEALMISADASRRAGDVSAAVDEYLRVSAHPKGGSFAEEAALRAAHLLAGMGRRQRALAVLGEAKRRFPSAPLAPERAALAAEQLRLDGLPEAAAAELESVPVSRASPAMARERLETAAMMLEVDPRRACELLTPLAGASIPASVREAARALEKRCGARSEE